MTKLVAVSLWLGTLMLTRAPREQIHFVRHRRGTAHGSETYVAKGLNNLALDVLSRRTDLRHLCCPDLVGNVF